MDQAAVVTFFHWFIVTGSVVMLILVAMAFTAMGKSTSSYEDESTGEGGGH